MKTTIRILSDSFAAGLVFLAAVSASCNKVPSENQRGTISWNYSRNFSTRSSAEIPDTDAFLLQVKNSSGEILYDGTYGSSPESMSVDPGSYTVKVLSRKFEAPEFSAPQFGDEQVAVVQQGMNTKVSLRCTQLNSGLRIRPSAEFSATCPGGTLKVKSSDGELNYSLSEKRIGYFKPGEISVSLVDGTASKTLLTRYLEACEILSLGITMPSGSGTQSGQSCSLSMSVDTVRSWNESEYVSGSEDGGQSGASKATAYGVSQAKQHTGEKGVWVCGYVVGGDMSSTKNGIIFKAPFNSLTNIAIASRTSVSDKSSCFSVQLSKGDIRSALNLVEHPELIGCKVYLKGDIVDAYYGIPGIQNLTEYEIKK